MSIEGEPAAICDEVRRYAAFLAESRIPAWAASECHQLREDWPFRTYASAHCRTLARERGAIARGKVADFLLVDGDPLAGLSQLRKVTAVVRGGTLHDSVELYRAVGVRA